MLDMTRDKIKKRLAKQREIEGDTSDIELLLKVCEITQTTNEWNALIKVRHYRYGVLSYETHHFYYPNTTLVALKEMFQDEIHKQYDEMDSWGEVGRWSIRK